MPQHEFVPLEDFRGYPASEMETRSKQFYDDIRRRRTVRDFSSRPVPIDVIQNCIRAAGTAPNGANLQPWHFSVVQDPEIKKQIRAAAEIEEREFYDGKAPQAWLDALAPLGTDSNKPFLEVAPFLIVVFSKTHEVLPDNTIVKHYYANESVGIATGFLISAFHHSGLATLTHTPSPMKFLNEILQRPVHERAFLVLVAGYPDENATVPKIKKKPLNEIMTIH